MDDLNPNDREEASKGFEYSMKIIQLDPSPNISTLNNSGPDIFGNKDKSFDDYLA